MATHKGEERRSISFPATQRADADEDRGESLSDVSSIQLVMRNLMDLFNDETGPPTPTTLGHSIIYKYLHLTCENPSPATRKLSPLDYYTLPKPDNPFRNVCGSSQNGAISLVPCISK